MKVTFPHMGHLKITVKALLEGLGLDIVVPPVCTKKTLSIGNKLAPEFACLPLKINLGNYLEAMELGADTIVMGGGVGPCRFGYYAQVQKEILKDLGCDINMVVLEPPDAHFSELLNKLKYIAKNPLKEILRGIHLAWVKTRAVDNLEKELHKVRPRQYEWSVADKIFEDAVAKIDKANNVSEINQIANDASIEIKNVPQDKNKKVIKIAIAGEIYTVLEPFVNFHMEKRLGKMGVEVHRTFSLSSWINENLIGGLLPYSRTKKKHARLARPYLEHFVGGHGRETVSSAVELSEEVSGLIQLAPLTCMPEIVAQTVLLRVNKEKGLPVMTLYIDEQTGEAGVMTRLEAFTDMLKRKNLREMVT